MGMNNEISSSTVSLFLAQDMIDPPLHIQDTADSPEMVVKSSASDEEVEIEKKDNSENDFTIAAVNNSVNESAMNVGENDGDDEEDIVADKKNVLNDVDEEEEEEDDDDDGDSGADEWSSAFDEGHNGRAPLGSYVELLFMYQHPGGIEGAMNDEAPIETYEPRCLSQMIVVCCTYADKLFQQQIGWENHNDEEEDEGNTEEGDVNRVAGIVPAKTMPLLLNQMRSIFESNCDVGNFDWWCNPFIQLIVRYAATSNDTKWLKLFVEYGADMTELDQGCLFDRSYSLTMRDTDATSSSEANDGVESTKENTDIIKHESITPLLPSCSPCLMMAKYLLSIIDINVHSLVMAQPPPLIRLPNHIPRMDTSRVLLINNTEVLSMLFAHCGHMIDFYSIHYDGKKLGKQSNSKIMQNIAFTRVIFGEQVPESTTNHKESDNDNCNSTSGEILEKNTVNNKTKFTMKTLFCLYCDHDLWALPNSVVLSILEGNYQCHNKDNDYLTLKRNHKKNNKNDAFHCNPWKPFNSHEQQLVRCVDTDDHSKRKSYVAISSFALEIFSFLLLHLSIVSSLDQEVNQGAIADKMDLEDLMMALFQYWERFHSQDQSNFISAIHMLFSYEIKCMERSQWRKNCIGGELIEMLALLNYTKVCKLLLSYAKQVPAFFIPGSGVYDTIKDINKEAISTDTTFYQMLVHKAVMSTWSVPLLSYLINEEGGNVNIVDTLKSYPSILFSLTRIGSHYFPELESRHQQFITMIRYLFQKEESSIGNVTSNETRAIEEGRRYGTIALIELDDGSRIRENTLQSSVLDRFYTMSAHKYLYTLLYCGYGYDIDIETYPTCYQPTELKELLQTVNVKPCSNIDDCLIYNQTMNPLHYLMAKNMERADFYCESDYPITTELIELFGASLHVPDKLFGNTPLMFAIQHQNIKLAQYLITKYGTTKDLGLSLKNVTGETALSLASGKDYQLKQLISELMNDETGGKEVNQGSKHTVTTVVATGNVDDDTSSHTVQNNVTKMERNESPEKAEDAANKNETMKEKTSSSWFCCSCF